MVNGDILKLFTCIVGDGSGCFFQPMNDTYTYILTAKHNLCEKRGALWFPKNDGSQIGIFQLINSQRGEWAESKIDFSLQPGVNYFPHKEADIAILKIPFVKFDHQIFAQNHFHDEEGFNLCGYPSDKRDNQPNKASWFKIHLIQRFTDSNGFLQSAEIFKNQEQENLMGISGGAIIKSNEGYISIIGIQSEIAKSNSPDGEFNFVPISFFNEIVQYEGFRDSLTPLLPPYMNNFRFLDKDIMLLEECIDPNFARQVRNVMVDLAKQINFTPFQIFSSTLKADLLVSGEPTSVFYSKRLWISWLEYLVILGLEKGAAVSLDETIWTSSEKRLIHSDTKKNWIEIIDRILETDFSGIKSDCIIIVSTNSRSTKMILDKGMLKSITDVRDVNMNIDRANQLQNVSKIIHIRAFESNCIESHEMNLRQFMGLRLPELIAQIKIKIDEIFQP